jgi:hypothetical protein
MNSIANRIVLITLSLTFAYQSFPIIDSLGHFKKGNKEVCIIDADHSFLSGDKRERAIVFSYIDRWSKKSNHTCCLIGSYKGEPEEHSIVKGVIKARRESKDTYIYLHDIFKYLAYLHENKYGNITFIKANATTKTQSLINATLIHFSDPLFTNTIAPMVQLDPSIQPLVLDQMLASDKKFKREFFKKGSTFDKIADCISKQLDYYLGTSTCTLKEYQEEINELLNEVNQCKENYSDDKAVCQIIEDHLMLINNNKSVNSFLKFYNNNDTGSCCVKSLFNAMRQKQSIQNVIATYGNGLYAGASIQDLKILLAVLDALKTFDKVYLCVDHGNVLQLYNNLEKAEFEKKCQGLLTPIVGAVLIEPSKRRFSDEQLCTFFDSIFIDNNTSTHAKYIDQKSISDNFIDKSFMRYHHGKVEIVATPVIIEDSVCSICKQIRKADTVFLTTTNKALCSPECYINSVITRSKPEYPLVEILDDQRTLNQDDSTVLEHLAALCYYHYILLLPSIALEHEPFYRLPHKKIIDRLNHLMKLIENGNENSKDKLLWKKAFDIAHIFGINPKYWSNLFKKGEELKQIYLKILLDTAKKKSYDTLLEETTTIIFDENDIVLKYQTILMGLIKHTLGLSSTTDATMVCRLYNELLQVINDRLKHCISDYESLLITQTQQEATSSGIDNLLQNLQLQNIQSAAKNTKNKTAAITHSYKASTSSRSPDIVPDTLSDTEVTIKPELYDPAQSDTFTLVGRREHVTPVVRDITDYFAGQERYYIKLYNAHDYLEATPENQQALSAWQRCSNFSYHYRVKVLFALIDNGIAQNTVRLIKNTYGCPALDYSGYESTLVDKLDLHHLFSRSVDDALNKFGIPELLDSTTLQVSIPGEIIYKDGTSSIGFFQYTFNINNKMCYHRCFQFYGTDNGYISPTLHSAFRTFLKKYDQLIVQEQN